MIGRIDHFAVNVELQLIAGGVADAHGTRISIAGQMLETALARSNVTKDVIEDAQFRMCDPSCEQQPIEKAFGFVPVPEPEQRAHSERSITKPAVAVVP